MASIREIRWANGETDLVFSSGAALPWTAKWVDGYSWIWDILSSGTTYNESVTLGMIANKSQGANTLMNANASFDISAEQTGGNANNINAIITLAANAGIALTPTQAMDAMISLSIALSLAQAGDVGAPSTYDEAITLVASAGMSPTAIQTMNTALTLAATLGKTQSCSATIAAALILQSTAAMMQTSVAQMLNVVVLPVTARMSLGTALVLQAAHLFEINAGFIPTIGGASHTDSATLGIQAGMAQTVTALINAAIGFNARAAQLQTNTLSAFERATLSLAVAHIESSIWNGNESVALGIVTQLQHASVVLGTAAARHVFEAMARKRIYDATARDRDHDATERDRIHDATKRTRDYSATERKREYDDE